MNKSQPVTQTTNTSTSIPSWLTDASKGAVTAGQNLPQYTPFTGEGVANLTPAQLQAISAAQGGAGMTQKMLMPGFTGATNAMNFAAPNVTAESLAPQIQGLLNPATQSVIDATNNQIDKNTATSVNNSDNALAAQHAFGGDRQAVADGVIRSQGDLTKASTAATLNQGNYNTALTAALQAAQGNQGASISGAANVNLPGANSFGNLAQTFSGLNINDLNGLLQTGGVQQNTGTQKDQFNYQNYLSGYQLPDTQATTLASILGSLPHDTSGTSNTTGQVYTNPLLGIAGLGLGIAGLGTGGGSTLGGSALKSIFG